MVQSEPTVVIVEDHAAVRRGIELLLDGRGCRVVGSTGEPAEAYELVLAAPPDVVIMDIRLPGESGARLASRILRSVPDQGVLLYTGLDDREDLTEALEAGARGFALKAGSPAELLEAVEAVAAGGEYMDPRLAALMLSRSVTDRVRLLSGREREILALLSDGLNGEQIAERLFISSETVRTHVRNAMGKLEAHTRVHAVALALRAHAIGPGVPPEEQWAAG